MSLQLAGDFRRFRPTQVIFDPSAISFLMCIFLQNELIKRHQQAKNASEFACVKCHTHGSKYGQVGLARIVLGTVPK